MVSEVEPLFDKGVQLLREEEMLLKLMTHLIHEYEEKNYALNASTPCGILLELMQARGVKASDLWDIFGSKGIASEVLSGKRSISKA